MLERPSNAWPSTDEAENIMFFAQCFHGFLDQNSFEGFRAYSLDTVGRLHELVAVSEDVIQGRMKDAALPPVLEEIIWSISNDEAVVGLAPGYTEILIQSKKNQKLSPHDIQFTCKAILRRVESKYKTKLVDGITDYLAKNKRTNLLTNAGYLASHLLGQGYDRNYLLERVHEEFFVKDVVDITPASVKAFLTNV